MQRSLSTPAVDGKIEAQPRQDLESAPATIQDCAALVEELLQLVEAIDNY